LDEWPERINNFNSNFFIKNFGEEVDNQIIQGYINKFNDDMPYENIWIEDFYAFSDYIIVMMDGPFTFSGITRDTIIDIYLFRYLKESPFLIWHQEAESERGYLYTLQEAYDAGILTESRLRGLEASGWCRRVSELAKGLKF
jgi:hypothetical protein